MKSLKTFLATATVLLAFTGLVSAANPTVRMVGSTAFRAATNQALKDMMSGTTLIKYDSSSLGASNNVYFEGTITSNAGLGTVIIKCHWSGSTEGIKFINNADTTQTFYQNNTGAVAGGAQVNTAPGNTLASDGVAPDFTMMDTSQGLTSFNTNTITNTKLCVLPFTWVAAKNTPSQLTNVTAQALRQLMATGRLSLSAFTGDPNDAPVTSTNATNANGWTVLLAGRDTGSGTRTSALAESGFGANNAVKQVQPQTTITVDIVAANNGADFIDVKTSDQTGISANMIGKPISGTNILAGTTILDVTDGSVLQLSQATTGDLPNVTVTIGDAASTTNSYYLTPGFGTFNGGASGNGGQNSGGSLADFLRWTITTPTKDPFNLQTGANHYNGKFTLISYLGLPDADRAVNGTSSGVSAGTNVGCRFLAYEGISCMGGVAKTYTIASQGATTNTLTTATNPITDGIIVGQLVGGTGIAPGTTVTATSATTITLSKATTNSGSLTNNSVKVLQLLPKVIRTGQYSFWSYERIGWRTAVADKLAVKDAFVSQITGSSTDLGSGFGIPDDADMQVTRSDVGSPISLKF